ncbi:MAG: DUF4440 domain-containing protein [Bauldia sp.]
MIARAICGAFLLLATVFPGVSAASAEDAAAAEIRATLEQWRVDFNARNAGHICDLFTKDLLYDFQGLPEQNYDLICARLNKALADTTRTFSYGLRIKEIIVVEPIAIVRLTWLSTLTLADGTSETDEEPGLDVFQRQADGAWKIVRYIAYPET